MTICIMVDSKERNLMDVIKKQYIVGKNLELRIAALEDNNDMIRFQRKHLGNISGWILDRCDKCDVQKIAHKEEINC